MNQNFCSIFTKTLFFKDKFIYQSIISAEFWFFP
jgi:hypothetical protein